MGWTGHFLAEKYHASMPQWTKYKSEITCTQWNPSRTSAMYFCEISCNLCIYFHSWRQKEQNMIQLLGDFVPKTSYQGFAPGPCWGLPSPGSSDLPPLKYWICHCMRISGITDGISLCRNRSEKWLDGVETSACDMRKHEWTQTLQSTCIEK